MAKGAAGQGHEQWQMVALLDWLQAMGVDAAVSEVATQWRSASPRSPGAEFDWSLLRSADEAREERTEAGQAAPMPSGMPGPAPATLSPGARAAPASPSPGPAVRAKPDRAVVAARQAAAEAPTLEALGAALAAFEGCSLKSTAKSLCFYRGAASAPLMIIGEAPGREEDIEGKPFVGRAGQLLDRMLAASGIDEASVHITNIVYWRPPGNRTPTPQEAEACRPFLERQIALVRPKVLLLLGGAAAKHVLRVEDGILRLRGAWRQIAVEGESFRTMASLHPAYLLRTPAAKRLAWRDLLAVQEALRAAGNGS